jgi:Na+(H+)/acetate symporter ActP
LACLVPVGAGTLLVVALGLAAATLGPAAVLACWSERATPQAMAGGAGAALAVFALLVVAGTMTAGTLSEGWGTLAVAAPAAVAAPVHLLIAWALRSRSAASPRRPLPPGLEGLSATLPTRPHAS